MWEHLLPVGRAVPFQVVVEEVLGGRDGLEVAGVPRRRRAAAHAGRRALQAGDVVGGVPAIAHWAGEGYKHPMEPG